MFSDVEIQDVWNKFSDSERDMPFEEFRKQVKAVFDPKKSVDDLNEMVEMRMRHTAGIREKRRINKALEQQKVSIG